MSVVSAISFYKHEQDILKDVNNQPMYREDLAFSHSLKMKRFSFIKDNQAWQMALKATKEAEKTATHFAS